MKTTSLLSAATYAYLATVASAVGPAVPENAERLPGKPDLMPNWPWHNPFADANNTRITISSESEASAPTRFVPTCSSQRTFRATEYLLDDLQELPPLGLIPWVEALRKTFTNRPYPGSWDGVDPHGYDRNMLMMEYVDVPLKVRRWIEEEEWSTAAAKGKGLFAVLAKADVEKGEKVVATATSLREKKPETEEEEREWREGDVNRVVIFAPGALYENAPLWVAEGSECEETLSDMTKYTAKPTDGGVVAYPVDKTRANRAEGKREMEFTIKAQVLKVDDSVPEEEEQQQQQEKGERAGQFKTQVEKVEEFKTQVEEVMEKVKTAMKDEL
ncbi:uncharacterized protein B0T23DRAFT_236974 [Neurospora hispaniola]|uniref:Uncharacterized protein n=1 Tax=Neurospora hispaniola TaxID=588809 RepID=A0AAJ0MNB3_9PEZI|nr:hypothetical protein B0T23DRAFT_236974 [Neurospora hispaniola]